MSPMVTLLTSGLYTTIQDEGRFGFSKYGVPKSGAMDQRSFLLANLLVGNDKKCALIEWALLPPILQFNEPTLISISGAICTPYINDKIKKMNTQLAIHKNDILKIKNIKNGVYGYIAIKNGFDTDIRLGSSSFYKGITDQYVLKKNNRIKYKSSHKYIHTNSSVLETGFWINSHTINCYKGPEFDQLGLKEREDLFSQIFTISDVRNRMAIQLTEQIPNELASMLTAPVLPGTVQLTPSGKLIILMRDCQTTGGYPRVLQLSEESINIIAQKREGEKIKFKLQAYAFD